MTKGVEAGAETTEAATREAATAANVAASVAQIAANKLETASWAELAAAMTFAAHAYIPFAGTAIASGMIAAQQAMIIAAGIPKYEKGALAFGPTLGIFGEYAGASHNPEVRRQEQKTVNAHEQAATKKLALLQIVLNKQPQSTPQQTNQQNRNKQREPDPRAAQQRAGAPR